MIGAGGVYPPPEGYLEGAQALCRHYGALFIADAVIGGFGRLGTWFGVERFGIRPDLIVFAKGVTSGYLPLGGLMVSSRVAETFYAPGAPTFRHGATYAAHPTCCAAALANLAILEREDLLGHSRQMEGELFQALERLTAHELVDSARGGVGMLGAIELAPTARAASPDLVARVFMRARELGVIVRPLASSLAVSPPLTATPGHLELLTGTLEAALDDVASTIGGPAPAHTAS